MLLTNFDRPGYGQLLDQPEEENLYQQAWDDAVSLLEAKRFRDLEALVRMMEEEVERQQKLVKHFQDKRDFYESEEAESKGRELVQKLTEKRDEAYSVEWLTGIRLDAVRRAYRRYAAFHEVNKWADLGEETQNAVLGEAKSGTPGRSRVIDGEPEQVATILKAILDFTEKPENKDRPFLTTTEGPSLCKHVAQRIASDQQMGITPKGVESKIRIVFKQVSAECKVDLPRAEANVEFYFENREQIQEALKVFERDFLKKPAT